jgi:hypothetical protein
MSRKEHLTSVGLQQIVNTRSAMNLGLTEVLRKSFPNTVAITRPLVENQVISHAQ